MANTTALIVGGAGLIGSAAARAILASGCLDVVVVDSLGETASRKWANVPAGVVDVVVPVELDAWLNKNWRDLAVIISAPEASDPDSADNVFEAHFTLPKQLFGWAVAKQRGFVFASSCAVYGNGPCVDEASFDAVAALKPLTAQGQAERLFEFHVLRAAKAGSVPPFWTGLRVFNAFGPEETYRDAQASLPFRASRAAKANMALQLPRSWSPALADGHHTGDYIHADDVGALFDWAASSASTLGILNAGTGIATTAHAVARAAFSLAGHQTQLSFTEPTDDEIRGTQRALRADITALRASGYSAPFVALEAGLASIAETL